MMARLTVLGRVRVKVKVRVRVRVMVRVSFAFHDGALDGPGQGQG